MSSTNARPLGAAPASPAASSPWAAAVSSSTGSPVSSTGCLISRHRWLAQAPSGSYLDPSGAMTPQPDQAWQFVCSAVAAARLQQLGLDDLDRWRLVPLVLTADPADPLRRWRLRADG